MESRTCLFGTRPLRIAHIYATSIEAPRCKNSAERDSELSGLLRCHLILCPSSSQAAVTSPQRASAWLSPFRRSMELREQLPTWPRSTHQCRPIYILGHLHILNELVRPAMTSRRRSLSPRRRHLDKDTRGTDSKGFKSASNPRLEA